MSKLASFAARLSDWIRRAPLPQIAGDGSVLHRPEAEARFNAWALELFGLQYQVNPAYRRLCEVRGVEPERVTHWSQIPAVPTVAFKELEMTCLPPQKRLREFRSSGTTQRAPSRHFHDATSLALYELSAWRWFGVHVVPEAEGDGMRVDGLILTPSPEQAPHSSLVHMFEVARRELGWGTEVFVERARADGAWELDEEAALRRLRRACEQGEPLVVLGTGFSFVHLLDALKARGLSLALPRGSRVMETGGYKGRTREVPQAELHAQISRQLGVPTESVVCEYGMCELSSQAYDTVAGALRAGCSVGGRRFRFPPWARALVISPETGREVASGQAGLLRVVDLANAFSVLAVQTEDLAVRREDGFELLGRAAHAEPRGCSLMAA